jgi:hypothetical protein
VKEVALVVVAAVEVGVEVVEVVLAAPLAVPWAAPLAVPWAVPLAVPLALRVAVLAASAGISAVVSAGALAGVLAGVLACVLAAAEAEAEAEPEAQVVVVVVAAPARTGTALRHPSEPLVGAGEEAAGLDSAGLGSAEGRVAAAECTTNLNLRTLHQASGTLPAYHPPYSALWKAHPGGGLRERQQHQHTPPESRRGEANSCRGNSTVPPLLDLRDSS